jgi:ribonuclease D
MPNITISLDENLVRCGRDYARKHGTSLNALIRKLLEETVTESAENWLDDCFNRMDRAQADSRGRKWRREDLYLL